MLSHKQIEQRTQKLLRETEVEALPIDVELVAHRLGLHVEGSDFTEDISGFLTLRGSKGVIMYNDSHPRVRQRFTIAHELGHFVLHKNQSDLFIDKKYPVWLRDANASTGENKMEVEANRFAAALLMPRDLVEYRYSELEFEFDLDDEETLTDLAKTFGVSQQAMSFRMSYLLGV